jgi:hypothetical protein
MLINFIVVPKILSKILWSGLDAKSLELKATHLCIPFSRQY